MNDVIARLRSMDAPLNRRCTAKQIRAMQAAQGRLLDADVVALYTDHNGMDDVGELGWRLMPSDEVIKVHESGLDGTIGVSLIDMWPYTITPPQDIGRNAMGRGSTIQHYG